MEICPICSKNTEISHQYDGGNSIFEGKKIFKCKNCEYHYCNQINPNDLNVYYEMSYDQNDYSRSKSFPSPNEYFSDRAKQFKPDRSDLHINCTAQYLKKKSCISVLDCGAGLGTTLNIAKKTFVNSELHAFENDLFAKTYLEYINVNQHSGDLVNFLRLNDIKFDVIICSHFLEHVSPKILNDVKDLLLDSLSKEGILLIEVPNDNWYKYPHKIHNNPPHVSFFSKTTLKNLFKQSNILSIGTLWGTSRRKINFFSSIFDFLSRKISQIIFKIPYIKHGDAILVLLQKHSS